MRNWIHPAVMIAVVAGLISGCEEALAPDAVSPTPAAIGADFDAKNTGSIRGCVRWEGGASQGAPISAPITDLQGQKSVRQFPNPNAPSIDTATRAVRGAVVLLEGVEPARARPWDQPRVHVSVDLERIRIDQGEAQGRIGFVRAGDDVDVVSTDSYLHVISARGAAFFGLTLPEPNRARKRRFNDSGLVELSSASARYWQRGYLWVCSHPYFTLTDATGNFTLDAVPAGDYRLVAWHPNPDLAGVDRDPNTCGVLRYRFAEPIRISQPIHIRAGETMSADFLLSK